MAAELGVAVELQQDVRGAGCVNVPVLVAGRVIVGMRGFHGVATRGCGLRLGREVLANLEFLQVGAAVQEVHGRRVGSARGDGGVVRGIGYRLVGAHMPAGQVQIGDGHGMHARVLRGEHAVECRGRARVPHADAVDGLQAVRVVEHVREVRDHARVPLAEVGQRGQLVVACEHVRQVGELLGGCPVGDAGDGAAARCAGLLRAQLRRMVEHLRHGGRVRHVQAAAVEAVQVRVVLEPSRHVHGGQAAVRLHVGDVGKVVVFGVRRRGGVGVDRRGVLQADGERDAPRQNVGADGGVVVLGDERGVVRVAGSARRCVQDVAVGRQFGDFLVRASRAVVGAHFEQAPVVALAGPCPPGVARGSVAAHRHAVGKEAAADARVVPNIGDVCRRAVDEPVARGHRVAVGQAAGRVEPHVVVVAVALQPHAVAHAQRGQRVFEAGFVEHDVHAERHRAQVVVVGQHVRARGDGGARARVAAIAVIDISVTGDGDHVPVVDVEALQFGAVVERLVELRDLGRDPVAHARDGGEVRRVVRVERHVEHLLDRGEGAGRGTARAEVGDAGKRGAPGERLVHAGGGRKVDLRRIRGFQVLVVEEPVAEVLDAHRAATVVGHEAVDEVLAVGGAGFDERAPRQACSVFGDGEVVAIGRGDAADGKRGVVDFVGVFVVIVLHVGGDVAPPHVLVVEQTEQAALAPVEPARERPFVGAGFRGERVVRREVARRAFPKRLFGIGVAALGLRAAAFAGALVAVPCPRAIGLAVVGQVVAGIGLVAFEAGVLQHHGAADGQPGKPLQVVEHVGLVDGSSAFAQEIPGVAALQGENQVGEAHVVSEHVLHRRGGRGVPTIQREFLNGGEAGEHVVEVLGAACVPAVHVVELFERFALVEHLGEVDHVRRVEVQAAERFELRQIGEPRREVLRRDRARGGDAQDVVGADDVFHNRLRIVRGAVLHAGVVGERVHVGACGGAGSAARVIALGLGVAARRRNG